MLTPEADIDLDSHGDASTTLAIGTGALEQVLKEVLQHHDLPAEEEGRGWDAYEYDDGTALVAVRVERCGCSHDCCGHLCGYSITIRPRDDRSFYVETRRSYNY